MPHLFGEGGSVLIHGLKFDLPRVIEAGTEALKALDRRFGTGNTRFTPDPDRYLAMSWPDPGDAVARRIWSQAAEIYDVVDQPLDFSIGVLTVRAYLLGKTWCVYHQEMDLLATPRGESVSALDPTPVLCLYGQRSREKGGNFYALPDTAVIDAVEGLLTGELAHLGLELERSETYEDPGRPDRHLQVGFIRFPHGRYGAGHGPIKVRCVTPDGGEVQRSISLN